MAKENEEIKEIEKNEEPNLVEVYFEEINEKYQFENVFMVGKLVDNTEDEITSFISGFKTVEEIIATFDNMMFQMISVLKDNSDNSIEEIISVMRESTDVIFEGTLNGKFDHYYKSLEEQK